MKEADLPREFTMGVYWYVDEETKEVVFDIDAMREEFDNTIDTLEAKYKGVKIDTEVSN